MTITGRTARYPSGGQLTYRVTDASGGQIGGGSFAVSGPVGQSASFSAECTFSVPPVGGPIQVTILDIDQASGAIIASGTVVLTGG